jgi:hypothetical protein
MQLSLDWKERAQTTCFQTVSQQSIRPSIRAHNSSIFCHILGGQSPYVKGAFPTSNAAENGPSEGSSHHWREAHGIYHRGKPKGMIGTARLPVLSSKIIRSFLLNHQSLAPLHNMRMTFVEGVPLVIDAPVRQESPPNRLEEYRREATLWLAGPLRNRFPVTRQGLRSVPSTCGLHHTTPKSGRLSA